MNVLLKRAGYINELTEKIRTDSDIKETVYLFDYGERWYTQDFHNGGHIENKVDKTLSYFSYICYLKKQRIITNKEFDFFKYEIERILLNKQVQDYLYNLYHFSNKFKIPLTFKYIFEYGDKLGKFEEDFYNKNSWKTNKNFHHYLNY